MPNPRLTSLTIPINGTPTTFDLGAESSGGGSEIPEGVEPVSITQNDYNQLTPEEKRDPTKIYFIQDGGEAASVKLLSITSEPSKTGYDSSNYIFDTTGLKVELQTILKGDTTSTDVTSSCTINPANGTDLSTYLNGQTGNVSVPVQVTYTDSDGNTYNKTFKLNVFSGGSGGGGEGGSEEPISGATYRLELYKPPTKTIYGTDDPMLDLTGYTVWLYTEVNGSSSHTDVTSQCTFEPANGTDLSSRIAELRSDGNELLPVVARYEHEGLTEYTNWVHYSVTLYKGNVSAPATYKFELGNHHFGYYGTDDFKFAHDKMDDVRGVFITNQGPATSRKYLTDQDFTIELKDGYDMRNFDPGAGLSTRTTIVPVKCTYVNEGTTYEDYGSAYYVNGPLTTYRLVISPVPTVPAEADHLAYYQLTDNTFNTSVFSKSYVARYKWKVDTYGDIAYENSGDPDAYGYYCLDTKIPSALTNINNVTFTLIPDGTIVKNRHTLANGHNMAQYAPTASGASQVYQIEARYAYKGFSLVYNFYCKVWNVDDPSFT